MRLEPEEIFAMSSPSLPRMWSTPSRVPTAHNAGPLPIGAKQVTREPISRLQSGPPSRVASEIDVRSRENRKTLSRLTSVRSGH
jgi:hypothetical protein